MAFGAPGAKKPQESGKKAETDGFSVLPEQVKWGENLIWQKERENQEFPTQTF